MTTQVSIIIVNWNGIEFLPNCLESIVERPPNTRFEIIVVDNASSDNSVAWLKSQEAAKLLENVNLTLIESHDTPQLTRLRMDLNTLVSEGFKTLGVVAVPFAILAGGIVGAVVALMITSFLTLVGHLIVWRRLDADLSDLTMEREAVKPLLKFDADSRGWHRRCPAIECRKGYSGRDGSSTALAHYSVAFNLATTITMFSGSMIQSLIPAFSQLQNPQSRDHLNSLYSREYESICSG